MKHYKEYDKIFLGTSDIASLVIRTSSMEQKVFEVGFGGDGDYLAYVVDNDCAPTPEHYKLVETVESIVWLKIYDDCGLTIDWKWSMPRNVEIYRAGTYGIIIKLVESD